MFLFFLLFPVITTTQLVYNSFQLDLNYRNFWEKGNYEELYNYLDASIKQTTNRQEFVKSHLDEYENINPYKIEFKQVAEEKSLTQIKERVQVSLIGYNKSLEKEIQLTWKREFGNWKIATLETLNTVETKTDAQLSLLCINPVKVTDWSKTYIATGTILNITPETVSQRVMKLTPRNYCIPIGIVGDTLKLDNNNGIEIIHETNPQ